jgi:hypothetical protein
VSRILTYIGRFAVIVIGYGVAALAASGFLHLLALGAAGLQPSEAPPFVIGSLFFSIPFVALFVGYFAFTPAAVAILVGEVSGQRNWLFYALAGGAVGLAVALLFWQGPAIGFETGTGAEDTITTPRLVASLVGSGIVGGIAYWLCAGRSAGNWRSTDERRGPISSGPPGS